MKSKYLKCIKLHLTNYLYLFRFRYIVNGSLFTPGMRDHVTCEQYWWRNILYINNWYPLREFCMIWSWYLANDMQFYIIAILLLTLSVRYFKVCATTLLCLLFTSWIITALFSLHFNYIHKVSQPFESFDFLYDKPWQRLGPYIIGMITGYIYFTVKTPPKISSFTNTVLWFLSLTVLSSVVFGTWDGSINVLATAFYVSLGHTAWGLSLVWITLSCCWGLSQTINSILSYPVIYPLSRLTYCAYLVHPVIQVVTSLQIDGPIHLQHVLIVSTNFKDSNLN